MGGYRGGFGGFGGGNQMQNLMKQAQKMQEEMQKVLESADLYAIYTIGERGGSMVYLSQPADYGYEIGKAIESKYVDEVKQALSSNTGYVSGYIEYNSRALIRSEVLELP